MIKNIIFDLDGLLADTERLHIKAYRQTMKEFSCELSTESYQSHWIRKGLGIEEYIEKHKLNLNPKEVHSRKLIIYWNLLDTELKPMPFAYDVLKNLRDNYRLFLASNSISKNVNKVIKNLDMKHFFENIAFKESVKRSKPFPDIFLYLSNEYNLIPDETVVLEDAQKGIDAAYAAGMKSIAVPTQYTSDNDFSKADIVVESLGDITIELIKQL
ncbi:MAG: HAD family phosphatase [Calditrichaeota bacterium]|nr:MAG: HAD family phosphatase [Calditrichota bacterium]